MFLSDFAIQLLFEPSSSTSLTNFLKKKERSKDFKNSKAGSLNLIRKLIARYNAKLKNFIRPIVNVCLRYLEASEVSAREKELSVNTLQDIVQIVNYQ